MTQYKGAEGHTPHTQSLTNLQVCCYTPEHCQATGLGTGPLNKGVGLEESAMTRHPEPQIHLCPGIQVHSEAKFWIIQSLALISSCKLLCFHVCTGVVSFQCYFWETCQEKCMFITVVLHSSIICLSSMFVL